MIQMEGLQSDISSISQDKESTEHRYQREISLMGRSFEMHKEEMERQLGDANRQHIRSARCVYIYIIIQFYLLF
jgi:hypothetical protein